MCCIVSSWEIAAVWHVSSSINCQIVEHTLRCVTVPTQSPNGAHHRIHVSMSRRHCFSVPFTGSQLSRLESYWCRCGHYSYWPVFLPGYKLIKASVLPYPFSQLRPMKSELLIVVSVAIRKSLAASKTTGVVNSWPLTDLLPVYLFNCRLLLP